MFSWIVAILLLSLPLTSQFLKRKEDLPDKNKDMYLFQDVSGHNKIPRKALFLSLDDIDNRINENYSVISLHHKDDDTVNHQDDSATGFSGDFIDEQTDYRYVINGAAVKSDYLNKPTNLENYLDRSNNLLSYRNTADDYDKIVFPLHYEGVSDKMTPVNRRIYASGSFENFGNKIDLKGKLKNLADNNPIDRLASSKTNSNNLNKINIHCNNTSLVEEKPILDLCHDINSSSRNSIDLDKKKSILSTANPNEKPIFKTTNNKSYIIETDKEKTSSLRYTFKVPQRNNTAMNKNKEISTPKILENIVKVPQKNNLTIIERKPISNDINKSSIRIDKKKHISSYKDSSDIFQDLEEYDMIPNKELSVSSPTNISSILKTFNNTGLIFNNDSIIQNMNNSNYLLTRYYPNSRHYNTTQTSTDDSFVDINKALGFHKYGGTTLTTYSISEYSTNGLEQATTPWSLSKHDINTVPMSTLNNYFNIKNQNLDSIFLNPSDQYKSEASFRNNSNLTGRNDKDKKKIPNNMVLSSNVRLLNLVGNNNTSLNKSQYNISNLIKQDIIHNENNKRIVSIDLGKHGFDMKVPNKIKTPVKGLSDFTDKISDKERTNLFSNLWNLDKQMEIKTVNETENSPNSVDKNNYLSVQLENFYAPQMIEKDFNHVNEKMDIDREKSENLNKTIRNITFSLNDESKAFLGLDKDLENVSSPIQSSKVKILNNYLTILNNSKVTTNKFSKQDTLNLVPLTLKNSAFTTLVPNNVMVVSHHGNESNVVTAAFGDILNKISISGILSKFKNISNIINKKVHATTTPTDLKDSKPIELDSDGNNINTLIITTKKKEYEKDNIKGKYNITSDSLGNQTNIDLKKILNLNKVSNSGHETTSFTSATKMNFSPIKTSIINSNVLNISRNPTIERLIKLPGIYINNLNIFLMDSKENIPQSEIIKVSAIPKKYPQDIKNRNLLVYDKTNMTSVTPKGNLRESNVLSSSSTLQRKITFLIQFPEIIDSKLNKRGPFEISSRNQSFHDKYEDDEITMIKPPIMGSAPSSSLADSKAYRNIKTYGNHKKNRIHKKMHLTIIEKEMNTPHKSLHREKNEDHITNVLQLQLPLVVDGSLKQEYQIQLSDELEVNDQDYFKTKNKKQHSSEILEKPPLASQQNFEKLRGFNEKNIHSMPKKLLDTYLMVSNSKISTPSGFIPITMSYNSKIIKPRSKLQEANIPMSHKNRYKIKLIQSDDLFNTRNHHRQKRNIANSLFQHLKNKLNWTDSQDFSKDYDSEKMSSKINDQTTIEEKGTLPNNCSSPFSNSESNKVIQNKCITSSNILEHVYATPRDIWRKNRQFFSSNKRGKYGGINKSDLENEKANSSETSNNSTFQGDRFLHSKYNYSNSNLFSVLNNANKNKLKVARRFSPIKINPMHDKAIVDILHIEQITHAYKNIKNSDIKSFKENVSPTKQLPTVNFISGHQTLAAYTERDINANLNISDHIVDNDFDFKGDNESKGTLSNDGLIDTTVNINYDNDKNNSSNDNIRNIQSPREQKSTYYNNDNDNYSYYNFKNDSSEVEDNYLTGSNLVSQDNELKKKLLYLIYLPVPIAYNKQQFLESSNVSGKHSTYDEFQIIPLIGTLTRSKIKTLLLSNNLTNNYNSSAIRSEIVRGRVMSKVNYTVNPNKFKNKVNNVYFRERNTTLLSPKIFETMINANNTTIDPPYNLFRVGNRYSFDKLPNPEIIEVIQEYNHFHESQIQTFPNLLFLNTNTNKNSSSLLSNVDLERPKSVQIHKYTGRTNVSEEHDPAKKGSKMFNSFFYAVKDENKVSIFKNHEAPNSSLFLGTKSRKVNSNLSKQINKISKDSSQKILKFSNSTGNVASIIIKSNTNTIRNSKLSSNSRKILNKKTNSNNNTNYWDRLFRNIQNTYSGIVSKIINITIQDDLYINPSSNNNSIKLTNVTHIPSKDNACKNQSLCDEKIDITKPFYSVEYNSSLLSPFESTPNTLFTNIWTDETYANITNINNRFAKSKTARTLHSEITESMLMSSIRREMSTTLSSNVLIDLTKEYNSYLSSKDNTTTKNLKYKSNKFFENSYNEEDSHEESFIFSSTTLPSRKFFDSPSTSQLILTSQPFKFKYQIEHPSMKIPANINSPGEQININLFSQNNLGQQIFSTEVSIFQTKYDGLKSFLSTKTRTSSKNQNTVPSFLNGIKENLRSESLSFKQANSSNVTGNKALAKSIIYKEEPEKFTLSSNLLGSVYSQISSERVNKNVLLNHSLKPVKTFSSTNKSNSEALTNEYHKITNMFSEMYQIKQIQRNETGLIYSKFNNLFYPTEKYNANIFETRNVVNSSEQHLNIITKYDSRSESESTNKLYGSSNNMFSFMNNMKNYQEYHYASSHHYETNAESLNNQYVVLQTTEINSMLNMLESADKNTMSERQVKIIDSHAEQNKLGKGTEMSSTFYNEDKFKGNLFNNSKQFIHLPHSYNPFESVSPTNEITQILNSTINYWKNITSEQKIGATKIDEDLSFGDKHIMQSPDSKHGETKCSYEIETSRLPTSNQLEKYVNLDVNKDESNKPYLQKTNRENTSSSNLIKIDDFVETNYLDNNTTNSSTLFQFISDTDEIENKEIVTPELNLNPNITFQTKNQITSNTSNDRLDDVKITLVNTDVPILNSTSNVDFNFNNTIIYTYDPDEIFNKTVNNLTKHNESNNIFIDKYINYSDPDQIKSKNDISINNNLTPHYKINSTIMETNNNNNNNSDPMIFGMEENKLSQTHKPAFDFIYNNGIGHETNTTKVHINNNSNDSNFSKSDDHLFITPVGSEINNSINVTNILIKNSYNETVLPDLGINMVPSLSGIEPEVTFSNAKYQEYNSTIVQTTKNHHNSFLPDSEINTVSLVSEPEDKHSTVIIHEDTDIKEQIGKNLNNSYINDLNINLVPTIPTLKIENIFYTGIPNQVHDQNVYINTDSNNPLLLLDKVTINSSIFDLEPENINNYFLSQNVRITNQQMNSSKTDVEDKLNLAPLLSAPGLEIINDNVIAFEVNNTTLPTNNNYNDSIYDEEINISLIPKVKDKKTQMNNSFNNVLINVTKIDSIPNMSTLVIDSLYNKDITNEVNKIELPTIISYTKPLVSNTEVNLVSSITTLEHKHIKNIIPQNSNVSYVKINNNHTNSILFDDEVNLIPTLSALVLDIIYSNNISYEINKTKVENTNIHTDPLTSGAELNITSPTFKPDHDKIHINGINYETNTVQIQLNTESSVPIFNNYGKMNLPPAKSDINTDEIQTNIIFNEVDSKMVQVNHSQTKSPIYDVKINTSFSLYPFEPKTIDKNVISKIINTTKIQNKMNNNTSSFVYDSVVNIVKTNSDLHLNNGTFNLSNFSSDPKFDFIPIKDNSFDVDKTKLLFGNNYNDPMISGSYVNSIIPTYRPSNDNILIGGIGFEINTTKEQINNNNTHVLNFNGGDNKSLTPLVITDTKNMYINSIPNKANGNTTYTNLLDSILIHNNSNMVPLSPPSSYIVFNNSISNEIDRSKVQKINNNYSESLIFAAEVNTIFPTYNPNHYNKQINVSINEIKPTKEQTKISENVKNNHFEVNLLPLMSAHENETKHSDRISNGIIVANGHNIQNTYAQSLLSVAHVNTNISTSTTYLKHGHTNINSLFQENNGTKLQMKTNPDPLLSNADVNIKPPISALKTEDGFNTTEIRKNVKLTDPLLSEVKLNLIPSRSKLKYDEIFINAMSQKGNSTKGETKASSSLANAGPHLIHNISILKPNPSSNKNISYIIKPTKVDINSIFNYSRLSEVPDYVVTTSYPNKYINNNLNNISFNMNKTRLQRDNNFTNTFLNDVRNHTPIISSINQPDKLHPNNIYNELKNIVVTPDNIDFVTTISPYFTNAEYLEPINLSFYNSTLLYPVSDLNVLNIRNPNKTLSFSHDKLDSIHADPLISTSVNMDLSLKPHDYIKYLQKFGSQTESVNDTLHYSFDNTVSMDSVTNHVMFPFINVSDYSSTNILNNTYDKSNYIHDQITSPSNILTNSFAVKDPNLDHKDFNVFSNTKGNELFPLYTKTHATGLLNQPNISSNAVIEKPHTMGDLVPSLSYRYNNTNSINHMTTNNIFPNINLSDLHLIDTNYHSNNIFNYSIGQIPTQRNPFNSSFSIIDPNFHHKDFKDSSSTTGIETWPFDTRTDAIKTLDQPDISVDVIVEKPQVMSDLADTLYYNYNNTNSMLNYVTTNRIFPSINLPALHLTNSIYNTNNVSNYDIVKIPTPSNQSNNSFSDMDPNFHINDFEVSSNTKGIEMFTIVSTKNTNESVKKTNISVNVVVEKPNAGDLSENLSYSYSDTIPMNYVTTNHTFTALNISNSPLNDTIYNSNIISSHEIGPIPTKITPLDSNFSVIDPSFHLKDFEVSSNIKGIEVFTFNTKTDTTELLNQTNIKVNVVGGKPHLVGDFTDDSTFGYSNTNFINDVTTNSVFPFINIQNHPLTDTIHNPNIIPKDEVGHIPTQNSPVNSSFLVIDPSFHHKDFKVSSNTKGIEILTLDNITDVIGSLKKPNISVNVVIEKPPVGDLPDNLSYSYSDTIPVNYVTTNYIFPALNISNYPLNNTIYNSNSIPNYDIGQIPTQSTPLDNSFSIIYPNFHHKDFEVSSNTKGIEIFTLDNITDVIESLKKPNISVNVVIEKPHVGDLTDSFSYSYSNTIPINYVTTNHTFTALNIGLIPTQSTPLDSSFSVINPNLHLKDFEVSSNVKGIELFTFDTKTNAIEILNQPNVKVNVFLRNPHLLSDLNDKSTYSHNNTNYMNYVTNDNDVTTNRIFTVINIQTHPLNDTIYNINSIYNYDIGRMSTKSNPFDNSFPIIDPNFKEFETTSNTIGINLPTFEIKTDVIDILNQQNIFVNAVIEKPHVLEDFNLKLSYSSNYTDPKHNVTDNEIFPTINILDNHLMATVQYPNSISNFDVGQIHIPSNTFDSSFLNTPLSFHHKDFEVSSNTRGIEIFTLVSTTDDIERLNQSNISFNLVVEKPHMVDLTDNLFYSYSSTIPMNYITTDNIFTAINISDYPLANTIYNTNNISNYDIGQIPTQISPFNTSFSVINPSFHLKDFEVSSNTKGIEIFTLGSTSNNNKRVKKKHISVNVVVEKPNAGDLPDNLSYSYSDTIPMNYVTTNHTFTALNISNGPLNGTIYNSNIISSHEIEPIPTKITPLDSNFSVIDPSFHLKDFEVSSNIKGIELFTFNTKTDTTELLNQTNIKVNVVGGKPHLVGDLTDNSTFGYSNTNFINDVTTNSVFPFINIQTHPLTDTIHNPNSIPKYDVGHIPTLSTTFDTSFPNIYQNFHHKEFEVSSDTKGIERLKQSNMSTQIFVEKPHIVGNLTDTLSYISNYVTTNRIFPAIYIPVHPLYDTIYNTNSIYNYDIGKIPTQINPIVLDPNFHHKYFEISSNISGIELFTLVNTTEKLKIAFDNINYKDKQYPSVLVNYVNKFVTEPPIIVNPIPENNYTFFEINKLYSQILPDHIQNSYNISTPTYIKESLVNETSLQYNGSVYVDEGKVTKNIISAEAINIISDHNVSPLPVLHIITSISNTTNFVKHNTDIPKPLINYSYFDSHTYSGSYMTTQTNNKIDLPFYAVNQTKIVLNSSDLEHNLKIKIDLPFIASNSEKSNTQINDLANKHNMSKANVQSLNKRGKRIKLNGFDNNNLQVSNVSDNLNLQIYGYFHEINKTQSNKHLNYSITSTAHHQQPNISEKSMKVLNYLGNYIANHAESNKLSNSLLKSEQTLNEGFNSHMVKEFHENYKSNENSKYFHNSISKPRASSLFTNFSSIPFQNNHTKPSIFTLLNMNHLNYSHHHVNHVNNVYQNMNHINYDHNGVNHESYAKQNINHISYAHQNINHINYDHQNMKNINNDHDVMNHEIYAQHNMNQTNYAYQNIQNLKSVGMVDKMIINNTLFKTMLQESSRGSKSNLLNSLKSSSNNILNQGSDGNMNIWSNVNTHPNASHNASPVSIIVIDKGIHVHNIDSNNNKQSSNKNNIFSKELDYQSSKRHKKRKILNKKRKFLIPLPKIKNKHKKRKMKFFKLG